MKPVRAIVSKSYLLDWMIKNYASLSKIEKTDLIIILTYVRLVYEYSLNLFVLAFEPKQIWLPLFFWMRSTALLPNVIIRTEEIWQSMSTEQHLRI